MAPHRRPAAALLARCPAARLRACAAPRRSSPATGPRSGCGRAATRRSRATSTPSPSLPGDVDVADEALQWCGRELERGFRIGAFDAVRVARVFVLCDAPALPGARLAAAEVREALLRAQGPRTAASAAGAPPRALDLPGRPRAPATSAPRSGSMRSPMLNLAAIHEAIAAAVPERECLVFRERRLSAGRGHGSHPAARRRAAPPRARLPPRARRPRRPRVRPGPRRALPLQRQRVSRGHARRVQGARRAVQRQLPLRRRGAALPVPRRRGARRDLPRVLRARCSRASAAQLPEVALWLQVADESGEALLPGALDYEAALAAAEPAPPRGLSPDDLYMLYTGGTTGMPKGVLWRQEDIFLAALAPRSVAPRLEALVARARAGPARARCRRRPSCTARRTGSPSACGTSAARSSCSRSPPPRPARHLGRRSSASASRRSPSSATPSRGRCSTRSRETPYDLSSLRLLTSGRRDPHRGAARTSCCGGCRGSASSTRSAPRRAGSRRRR